MVLSYFRPERRYARRLARAARWDRPITTTGQRLAAWTNSLINDHGLFRLIYPNFHRTTPKLWRSAQPVPYQLAWLARRGLRTVVTLRGGREFGCWPLEREACEQLGLDLVELTARSREAPTAAFVLELRDMFARISYPVLIHCKSGADRAGLVSALYLILVEGRPADEALRQLSWRYGHWRASKTGLLDAFIEAYRDTGEAKGLDLITWVTTVYDPEKLTRDFRPGFWSNLMVDRVLRRE